MDALRPNFTPAPVVKTLINIGALLDVPTGFILECRFGEHVINGGLATFTGVVGIGNNFKTTVMDHMSFTALARTQESTGSDYDTEVNKHEHQISDGRIRTVHDLLGEDVLMTGRWIHTDKTVYSGNEWYAQQKEFLENKVKNSKVLSRDTPFWNRERTGFMQMLVPTITSVDSFTEFETDDVIDMQDKNELGDSGGNTIHMRQGLAKLRFLMEAPRLNGAAYNYLLMTAHIGKESTMQNAGPGGQVPVKKLATLKHGDKIKGTTDKFTFVTHNCWQCFDSKAITADDRMGPKWPKDEFDRAKDEQDLKEVKITLLRGKSGPSGQNISIIVSQREGVKADLTEFNHCKTLGNFGFEGNNTTYSLSLMPEVKLMRTTVRGLFDTNPRLRRAMNITSEILQMTYLWPQWRDLYCTMKELYDDIKALGYDWDMLLDTRGWWTYNNHLQDVQFLSSFDLLRMRKKLYVPYWLTDEQVPAAVKDVVRPDQAFYLESLKKHRAQLKKAA